MAYEIERRFLIKNDGWKKFITKKTNIVQGYFLTEANEWTIRLRSENKKFKLTFKKPIRNFTNYEFEYEIPDSEGEIILSTLNNKICKDRFYLLINQKYWVIDIFQDKNYPLEIAEIELENEKENIIIPDFLSKEITGYNQFSNYSLAKLPISNWEDEDLKDFCL